MHPLWMDTCDLRRRASSTSPCADWGGRALPSGLSNTAVSAARPHVPTAVTPLCPRRAPATVRARCCRLAAAFCLSPPCKSGAVWDRIRSAPRVPVGLAGPPIVGAGGARRGHINPQVVGNGPNVPVPAGGLWTALGGLGSLSQGGRDGDQRGGLGGDSPVAPV